MIDPLAELDRLCRALDLRSRLVAEADAWYSGDHEIPEPPVNTAARIDAEAKRAYQEMARLAITNMIPPIVNEPAKKLRVEGFQFGETATSTDIEAWRIWQRNYLDADAPQAFRTAVKTGQAFGIVWADADGLAEITLEDPSQVIVSYTAGSRRKRRSALKRWVDEDGYTHATLYLPDAVYKFQSASKAALVNTQLLAVPAPAAATWEPREVPGEVWPLPNPLGVVPVVELAVGAGLRVAPFGGGVPQFWGQRNEQRKINATVMNLLVTLENQAFRQRWATGWDYPLREDGTPDVAAMAKASASRLWALEGEDVTVGEFAQADFRPFIDVLTYWTKVIAFSSSTPPHAFLLGEMVNVAADSLARLDGSHLDMVRSLADTLGEGCEELLRLALMVEGNPKASDTASSVRWAEFENRTATEQMGVASGLKALGAPAEQVFAAVPGVSQQEARRWALQNGSDSIIASVLATPQDPAPPDVTPVQ